MKFVVSWLALLIPLANQPVIAEETPLWEAFDHWQVRIDTTLHDSCFVVLAREETLLRMGLDYSDSTFYILIANSDWESIEIGKEYGLDIELDSAGAWDIPFQGINWGEMKALISWVPLGDNLEELTSEIMRKHNMYIRYNGEQIAKIPMKGSYQAFTSLAECVQATAPDGGSRDDKDPFSDPPSTEDPFT